LLLRLLLAIEGVLAILTLASRGAWVSNLIAGAVGAAAARFAAAAGHRTATVLVLSEGSGAECNCLVDNWVVNNCSIRYSVKLIDGEEVLDNSVACTYTVEVLALFLHNYS